MYQRAKKEILGPDWVASTSYVPPIYDCTMPKKPLDKVSTLREFIRSCVELMKDDIGLNTLCEMIDHFMQERKVPSAHRVVNHMLRKKRANIEL
jgi:hypothetical protein